MSQVFISHVEEDAKVAIGIAEGLEREGYTAWYYERDSLPGLSYLDAILEEIGQCQAMVVIISPHTLMKAGQVGAEVIQAHETGKIFIPVLIDLTHAQFRERRRDWAMAMGASTSIALPPEGAAAISPRIVAGLKRLGVAPERPPVAVAPVAPSVTIAPAPPVTQALGQPVPQALGQPVAQAAGPLVDQARAQPAIVSTPAAVAPAPPQPSPWGPALRAETAGAAVMDPPAPREGARDALAEVPGQITWSATPGEAASTTAGAASRRYAGLGRRLGAALIDLALIGLVQLVLLLLIGVTSENGNATALGVSFMMCSLALPWLYHAIMESSAKQATVGKAALNLVVTGERGQRLSFWQATWRFVAKCVSALPLFAGFVMAAFHPQRQALHDRAARSVVVQR